MTTYPDAAAADSAAARYTKLTGTAREAVRLDVQRRAREARDAGRPAQTYTELLIAALDAVDKLRETVAFDVVTVEELRAATEAAERLGDAPTAADLAAAGIDVSMPDGLEQVQLAAALEDEVDRRPMHERSTPKDTPQQLAPEVKGGGCRRCGGSPEVHTGRLRSHAFVP